LHSAILFAYLFEGGYAQCFVIASKLLNGEDRSMRRALDLGCGRNKVPGTIGVDRYAVQGVDIVHDLDRYPYPFQAGSIDEIHARHVIEHVESAVYFMAELHRIGRKGARIYIHTPHYSYTGSWRDPTHRRHFSCYSFEYFAEGHPADYYAGAGRFRVLSVYVSLLRLWRILGIEFLVNAVNRHHRWRIFRKVWEEYFAFCMRAREIRAVIEVVK
jgi:SAM-dependent methyltransferase